MSTGLADLGCALVRTTVNRGFTPEEIAERALDKIMYVGENAPPVIRDQALAFREQLRGILVYYMREAVKSDRTTQIFKFQEAGYPELIKLLEQ